jgi:peptidyl-prolyl cis-trans isomerase A (cyclophilin A)
MVKIYLFLLLILLPAGFDFQNTDKNPLILIDTELGNITIELYADKAPVTVSNFLRYVDAGLYSNSCFYRIVRSDNQPNDSVKIAVIQGGRFKNEENGFPPIKIETTNITGIFHKDGVISMARSSPDSATSEFFICIGDQPELDFGGRRNRDGKGFAAFGKVLKGYEVINKIHSIMVPGQYPEKKIIINKIIHIKS